MNCIVSNNARDIHQYMISKGLATSNEVLQMKLRIVELEKEKSKMKKQMKEREAHMKIQLKREEFSRIAGGLMEYCWHTNNNEDVVTDYMEEAYIKYGNAGIYDILMGMKDGCTEETCEECEEILEEFAPCE